MSIKQISKFNYELIFDFSSSSSFLQPLIESILELIPNSYIVNSEIESKSESKYSIHFYANEVHYLNPNLNMNQNKQLLNYHETLFMIHDLNKQNDFLRNNYDCGFFCLDLNNILMIDSSIFIFTHPKFIRKIHLDHFVFQSPFSRSSNSTFFSPELMAMNSLPSTVGFKCFYYSLGSLCIFCLFGIKIELKDDSHSINKILKPIYQTKLSWTLLKLTDLDIERRMLIYI
jgi:hypothetical protein